MLFRLVEAGYDEDLNLEYGTLNNNSKFLQGFTSLLQPSEMINIIQDLSKIEYDEQLYDVEDVTFVFPNEDLGEAPCVNIYVIPHE